MDWRGLLLGETFSKHCIYHALVPTLFVCHTASWVDVMSHVSDADQIRAQAENLKCHRCERCVADKHVQLALRCMVGHLETEQMHLYKISWGTASLCAGCARDAVISVDADSTVLEAIFTKLEEASIHVGAAHLNLQVPAETLVRKCLEQFPAKEFVSLIQRPVNVCGGCAKRGASKRCTGCQYMYYCSAECSRAHWPTHKAGCTLLSQGRVFGASFIEQPIHLQ